MFDVSSIATPPNVIHLAKPTPSRHELTEFEDGECYPLELADILINAYSRPGELVFDPFVGSGTTLVAAQAAGRRGLGLEIHAERVEWCRARLDDPSWVRHGDATIMEAYTLPTVDLVLTSPPYMTRLHHPENPLTGYQTTDGDYLRYLTELANVFKSAVALLRPNGKLVVNIANMIDAGHVTSLAWDMAARLHTIADFEREIVIDWEPAPDWITMDYCLVYTKRM